MNRYSLPLLASSLLLLVSAESSVAAEKPMLSHGVIAFVRFYGEPEKSFENVMGTNRMWKRGGLLVTHLDGKDGFRRLTVQKVDGTEINRREAFAIVERFCGVLVWALQSQSEVAEIYASPDRAIQLTYQIPKQEGGINYIAMRLLPQPKGIEEL